MSDVSPTPSELAEDVAESHEQPFWKRVAVLSGGLLYLGLARVIIPAAAVAVLVEVLFT